ncbi:hypothetical protein ACQY1Q_00005 [Tenacibaculum sp. TC6]|uniref:hypothetical protein n=1 Tax=Tenacibaculum sp. TC6 TaxID=3423223 RepID=UPI003D35E95D
MSDKIIEKYFDNVAYKTVVTLLGVIGAVVTIYAFLQEKKVDLRYEIIANTNVLDFNADISKLEVAYDSTNLKQTGENLRIYTVKIVNNGNENIIKEFYDENDLVGIKLSSGKIIEKPELIQSSNDYLKRNLHFKDYQKDKVIFSRVILESEEFFIIKLLVLHKINEIPEIISFGKIAGQQKIAVVNSTDVKQELTFLKKAFYGNFWTQLSRLIAYFIIGAIIFILIMELSVKLDKRKEYNRKRKNVVNFKNLKDYQYTRMDDAIFDRYLEGKYSFMGLSNLKEISNLVKDEKELNDKYKVLSEHVKSKEYKLFRRDGGDWSLINEMLNDGIVFKENEELRINQAMKDTLEKFLDYLSSKGEF